MPKSKSIERLEEQMTHVQPGSLRHEVLESAKRFKSSWIDLGRALWTVWKGKHFKQWGYISFDTYCGKEIGIRSATAKKLLQSYYFLEREEPSTLKRLDEGTPLELPSADSVNMLRLLKKRPGVPPQTYDQVRSTVLEQGKDAPEVRRQVRVALESSERPPSQEADKDLKKAKVRRMITTLKAVRYELAVDQLVPKKLLGEIETLVKKLEGAVEGS